MCRELARRTGIPYEVQHNLTTADAPQEQEFSVKRANKEDVKRILAVYYEQNVTTERFEDFDVERWIIPNDF